MYVEKITSLDELKQKGFQIEPKGILVENTLNDLLKKRKMNVINLSEKTGLSRQTVHNIMNGTFTPGIDIVLKIAAVLHIPVEEFFYLKENAWFSRIKKAGERTLYVDVLQLTIYDKEAMDQEIKENGIMYYDKQNGEVLTEKARNQMLQMQFEHISNNSTELYALLGEEEKIDKRSIHRLLKEKLEEMSEEHIIPKFQKLVRTIPR